MTSMNGMGQEADIGLLDFDGAIRVEGRESSSLCGFMCRWPGAPLRAFSLARTSRRLLPHRKVVAENFLPSGHNGRSQMSVPN
jgi:hypothetical protein